MIVLPPKNLGIPAREPITLSNQLPHLRKYPRVLGIDDFALRKGRVYATILIDAETGRRVDVLEGRTAGVAEAWLRAHPASRSSPATGPAPTARPSSYVRG
jgi:hypothetical protein